jgi:hypothetical protein
LIPRRIIYNQNFCPKTIQNSFPRANKQASSRGVTATRGPLRNNKENVQKRRSISAAPVHKYLPNLLTTALGRKTLLFRVDSLSFHFFFIPKTKSLFQSFFLQFVHSLTLLTQFVRPEHSF